MYMVGIKLYYAAQLTVQLVRSFEKLGNNRNIYRYELLICRRLFSSLKVVSAITCTNGITLSRACQSATVAPSNSVIVVVHALTILETIAGYVTEINSIEILLF